MNISAKQQELRDRFGSIPDAREKLAAIVDWSKHLPRLTAVQRTPANRVAGCVSPVWVSVEERTGLLRIRADADSPVVRGLVCLLCAVYDEAAPAEIFVKETTLLDDLGLIQSLSITRRNGLIAVRKRLREQAQCAAEQVS